MLKPKFLAIISAFLFASSVRAQNDQLNSETNQAELLQLAKQWRNEKIQRLKNGQSLINSQQLETKTVSENGVISEYQGLGEDGRLLFYITDNLDAARTLSTDKIWPGGGLGYNFTGSGMIVGEWDGGQVRTTHQELTGRAFQLDSTSSWEDHPTHVAGTMIASGVDSSAKGMAYSATLRAFDWNFDDSEMATEAAGGLLISNHSYGSITGWRYNSSTSEDEWWGDTTLSASQDYKFGQYNSQSQSWDLIARNAPYYLIVKSAGNDRGDNASGTHYLPLHGVYSTTSRPADGGTSGYDCISTYSGAKNILTIGAVGAIPGGYSGPSSVVMSSFSGWGPTDDGRIKPDLVANGVGVYSSLATSNSAYASWNGTSMAAPNAAGSLVLVQQAYTTKNSVYMKAATLKALAIHTADEAGSAPGPDYMHGWGLINTANAVLHINDTTGTKAITETNLTNSNTYSFNVSVNGFTPIKATLCWTDVPGTPPSSPLNNTTAMLVNDLDIRIIRDSDSTIYYPYILNPASPASGATTGDNFRDNVEQIYIASPAAGSYTVVVSHKGTLSGGSSQDFSLIFDGGIPPAQPLICASVVTAPAFWDFDTLTNCSSTAGAACVIPSWYGWENSTVDDIDWTVDNGGTTSPNTGPSVDFTTGTSTGKYVYTEASTNGTGFPNKEAILYSPCIDLDTLTNSELAFAYHMYGLDMGTLTVEVFNGFGWTPLWSITGNQGDEWKTAAVDLSLFDGDTIQLRFIGVTGSNFTSDIAIDGIEIREFVSCPGPSNFNVSSITDSTAVFGWSSSASFWKISLNIKGGASVIPPTTINFNPVLFSGLIPNTTYEIYLQDSCGLNDTSAWAGPIEFTTTGPVLNPSPCGLNAAIPDNTCPNKVYLPVQVSSSGSQLGIDVFLSEVKVIMSHTWDSDLEFYIASPAGDTVLLSSGNGSDGDNYGNPLDVTCNQTTTFSMSASTSITSGTAPFIGSYIPEESLTNVHTGSDPNGIWKFIICDAFSGDVGTLEYIEFVFDTVAPVVPANCAMTVNSFSAFYDFDTLSNCSSTSGSACNLPAWYGWVNETSDDVDWTVWSGSTTSSNTGPTRDFTMGNTLGKYLYVEASTSGTGFPNKQAILTSPCFDISSLTNPELVFAYNMYGSTMGSLSLEVLSGGSWIQEWTMTGNDTTWYQAYVDLSAYSDTIKLRFVGVTGSNYESDMAIDGVEIREKPPCSDPSNVIFSSITDTTAVAAWTSTATYHRIRLDIHDSTTIISPATINFNPVFFFNLLPNTTYDFYVQDSCVNDTSDWIGPYSFTTTGPQSNPTDCGLNAAIPDNNCPNLSYLRIEVTTPHTQLGVNGELKEVRVLIEHTYDADLSFGLVSPGNDTVALSLGNGGSGNNYGNPLDTTCSQFTTFTMAASTPISSGTAPFLGSYIPDGDLTDFNTGINPNGEWKFVICDNASADVGTLEYVELIFDSSITCHPPTVTISNVASDSICAGQNTYIYSNTAGVSYQWYKNGTIIPGATNIGLTVSDAGNYNVMVDTFAGCGDSAQFGRIIVVNSLPVVSISNLGSSSFCDGGNTTLSIANSGTYQWYKNGLLQSSAINSTLNVTTSGDYNAVVTDILGCSDSASAPISVTVFNLPNVGLNTTGSPTFCDGSSVMISSTISGNSYIWYKDGTVIAGATSISHTASTAGNYNVVVQDANSCSDSAAAGVNVVVNPLPVVAITANGNTSFCNEDSVILSASSGSSYQWWESGVLLPGATGQNLTVKSSGSYNVEVIDANNCMDSATSSTVTSVKALPVSTISPGDTSICQGDTAWLQVNPGFAAYNWIVSGNPSGWSNDQNIPVSTAGIYTVIVENNDNCIDTASNTVAISINNLPNVSLSPFDDECNISPPFTLSGGSPTGGNYSGIGVSGGQFDPGAAGPGTHDITYTYSDANTCADSSTQSILVKNCTGIDEQGNDGKMLIYPNPTSGLINIEFDQNWKGSLSVQIYTADGALVSQKNIEKVENNKKIILNIDEQSNGIYFLHLLKGQEKWIQKIILEKNF